MEPIEALIPIAVFATTFGIVYVCVTAWHRQRMAMIEKGADPKLFAHRHGSIALALGLLLSGIGVGIALGWVADRLINGPAWGDNPGPYMVASLICGGAALILYHRITRRQQQ